MFSVVKTLTKSSNRLILWFIYKNSLLSMFLTLIVSNQHTLGISKTNIHSRTKQNKSKMQVRHGELTTVYCLQYCHLPLFPECHLRYSHMFLAWKYHFTSTEIHLCLYVRKINQFQVVLDEQEWKECPTTISCLYPHPQI